MSITPEFGTELIGQTETALGAIVGRQLGAQIELNDLGAFPA